MWFWGPVMIVFGGLMALGWSVRPRETNAGSFTNEQTALTTAFDTMIGEAVSYPNVSSVTVSFKGPLPVSAADREYYSDKQTELWSYNRRLGAMIGVFLARKNGGVHYQKVTCESMSDEKLKALKGKGASIAASPTEFGCTAEDPRDIGGKLPDELQQKKGGPKAGRPAESPVM